MSKANQVESKLLNMSENKTFKFVPCDGVELSSDVAEVLEKTYKPFYQALKQDEHQTVLESLARIVKKIISTPPLISVVRINTTKISLAEATKILQKEINMEEKEEEQFFEVFCIDEIPDALFIKSKVPHKSPQPENKEVIVSEICGSAVLRGANIFAPGVFGADVGMKKGDIVSVYADIHGKCRRGFATKFVGSKCYLGNAVACLSRGDLFVDNVSKGVALKMVNPIYNLPSFSNITSSLFFPQNLPSLLVAHVLNPQPGDLVIDMCAAPGGKATHLAQLMNDRGCVIAIDKTKNKVEKLKANCQELGLNSVKCMAFDSAKICKDDTSSDLNTEVDAQALLPPFPRYTFDRVLLDPPCSALGQRPRLSCKLTGKELHSHPVYQRKLLRQAIQLLKPGGIFVYSTCTWTVDENENQVQWILDTFPDMVLTKQEHSFGLPGMKGHQLSDDNCCLVRRFDPFLFYFKRGSDCTCHQLSVTSDTIGFFIAKFIKR